jgi:phage terminase Nu1 subunit (DNA packaging protein)
MMANRAQCCAIFGWSPREFDQNVASGLPAKKKTSSRGETWAVDTVAAVTWTVTRAMAEAGLVVSGAAPLDLDAERARLAKEQADRAAMENERLRGRLVDAEAVKRLIERLVGAANARLGALPSKLAPVVRPDDPVTARRHLELGIEEVRAELRRLDVDEARDAAA